MMKPEEINVVITHGDCPDGLGAAWSVHKKLGDKCEYYFVGHSDKKIPDIKGKNVLMTDFVYLDIGLMDELYSQSNKMLVLDHHKKAQELLEGKIKCDHIFDISRSGARMAWDYVFPNEEPPDLIRYIEDRDLYNWQFSDTRSFVSALDAQPQTFEMYDEIANYDDKMLEDFKMDGAAILKFQRKLVENAIESASKAEIVCPDKTVYKCYVANISSKEIISDAAHMMAKIDPNINIGFSWCYSYKKKVYFVSLRSINNINVANIAYQFGGGGHPPAAGFQCEDIHKIVRKI